MGIMSKDRIGMENRMDTFIDKLAQKRNAQEMIRANSAAEAARMEQMQNQLKAYDEIMQEIRSVNLKTAENVAEVKKVLEECMEKLQGMETGGAQSVDMEQTLSQVKALLEERLKQSEDFVHKENVKVYRNVQAAFTGLIVAGVFNNSTKTKNGALESGAGLKGLVRKIMMKRTLL